MKKALIYIMAVFFVMGCASGPATKTDIVSQEVNRLSQPAKQLSSFSNFELQAMSLHDQVSNKRDKTAIAGQLEQKLRTKVLPLLEKWTADAKNSKAAGTLIIKPKLQSLRVVSGGARFWIGGMAGDSNIDMNLELVDGKTGTVIANPRINPSSSAIGGTRSVGATDRNLLNYIVDISYQYLTESYN